jgi:hypothetical protein
LLAIAFSVACGADTGPLEVGGEVPSVFDKFADGVEISLDGSNVVIRSDGVPNHGSPYFNASDSRYEAYNGNNSQFYLNPNRIAEHQLTFRIPANPVPSSNPSATPLGPIGVAVNGVPIFNQYAGPNQPLTFEIDSFDQFNGHPQQTGQYHYHVEPLYITLAAGRSTLIGFLLDGFPIYGPEEEGQTVTNDDLDAFHGHVGVTADYPAGIYHYHITFEDPYINGNGFYGVPGSVS